MPFDGTEVFDNNPIVKLGAVERLLATEQQWCKGRLRDAHGRHCLVGAIEAVGGRQTLQKVVLQAAREVSGKRYWRIEFFNDDPRTTHADVLQVLQRARENMIAGIMSASSRESRYERFTRALRGLCSRSDDVGGASPAAGAGLRILLSDAVAADEAPVARNSAGGDLRKDRAAVLELQD